MIRRDDITGVILCGGDARRMHGVEKSLQLLAGVPLVHHVRASLAPQVGRVLVSANREQRTYRQWVDQDDIVADQQRGLGPLGGIASVIPQVRTAWLFCCPGDAPFLHHSLVSRLSAPLNGNADAMLSIPSDGERVQNLFLFMRHSVAAELPAYLSSGGRSVRGFIEQTAHVVVDASDIRDSFLNINTDDELRAANASPGPTNSSRSTPNLSSSPAL